MYKVYFLDGYEITDVESVETTSARNITSHHGLGKGDFPIADDKDLKAWVVKCQQESTELFKVLDNLLKIQDESRLIVSSDTENFSELVYLESYTKVEQNAGVFDVTMKFIEYVPVSVKTTDVPYIKRPGKAPVLPKKVVFNGKDKTPYKVGLQAMAHADKSFKQNQLYLDEFGKPTSNPVLAKEAWSYALHSTTESPIDYVIDDSPKTGFIEQNWNDLKTQIIEPMFGITKPKEREAIRQQKEREGCALFLRTLEEQKKNLYSKKK